MRFLGLGSLHEDSATNDFPLPVAATILQVDGYAGYNRLTAGPERAARRYGWITIGPAPSGAFAKSTTAEVRRSLPT